MESRTGEMTKKKRKLTSCVTTSEKKGTQEQSPEKKELPCALATKEPEAETELWGGCELENKGDCSW